MSTAHASIATESQNTDRTHAESDIHRQRQTEGRTDGRTDRQTRKETETETETETTAETETQK